MKKRIAIWSVLLAMVLTLLAPAAFAEEEPAWSAAYRSFIIDHGFASSGQKYGDIGLEGGELSYQYVSFGLYDLGSDGIPELIANSGAIARADMARYVYTFEDGQVKYLGRFGAYEGGGVYAPGTIYGGLFDRWMQMGVGEVIYATYEDGIYEQKTVYKFEMVDTHTSEYEYEQITEDDALNQIALSVIQAYEDAGVNEQTYESNYPYVLSVRSLSDIEAMGWDAFVAEYETRNEAIRSGLKYRIERIDHSFTLQGEGSWSGTDLVMNNYYDCVEIVPAETDAIQTINAALKKAAEEFLTQEVPSQDEPWNFPVPSISHYTENQSVFLNDDMISVCGKDEMFFGGVMNSRFHCFNFDIKSGDRIPLSTYLGLSEEETKTLVRNAVSEAGYERTEEYFQNTAVADYQYYIDLAERLHIVFDTYAIAAGAVGAVDIPLDYVPEPQIVSEPEETVESEDDAVSMSVHCYGPDLEYAWEYSDDDGANWVPADCALPVISIPKAEASEGRLYRCAVMNSAGQTYSKPVKLTAALLDSVEAPEPEGSAAEETAPTGRFPAWLVLVAGALALLALILLLLLPRLRRGKHALPEAEITAQVKEAPAAPQAQARTGPKFCPRCGARTVGGEVFCTKCGHPFQKR